ncbi:fimbrial protein [Pseudomonas sp. TH31]|nr:fimbrial protein [Pseudomonas sp. TH31]
MDQGSSTITDVRRTNIPGIGIRWSNHSDVTGTTAIWTQKSLNDGSAPRGIRGIGTSVFTDTFELIKLGDITSAVSPSWVLDYAYRGQNNVDRGRLYSNTASARNMQIVACSVTNTSIPIDMGRAKISEFSGVSSTARERSVIIPLDCDANTRVNITLDGTPHSSGAAGVLALNPSPTQTVASGVGVQLLHNGAPVTFRTPIAAGTAVIDGAYSIPLTARYYQTADPITEGQANSTATFTMSYR